MKSSSQSKQPGVIARFNQLLISEPCAMATVNASMPPGIFKDSHEAQVMRSHLTGLLCVIGWWWSESREGDLPIEMPSDFIEMASRSGEASLTLEALGGIGGRLLPKVLPLADISDSSISAQCALYHWFDLLRSRSPDIEEAQQLLWQWLISIGASRQLVA